MSEARFEEFLAGELHRWLEQRLVPGQRYQFRSPDSNNINLLMAHYRRSASGTLDVSGTKIPFVDIGGVRVLCVSHAEGKEASLGFNENYISMLRDRVAEQADLFWNTGLLVLHNSLLDTLINSAVDLADQSHPWSTASVRKSLLELAKANKKPDRVYDCLLKWQAELIAEDGSSVFSFQQLHSSIAHQNDLDLRPLGLFNDVGLGAMNKPQHIKRRVEGNRSLHEEIETVVERHPDEIAEQLGISEAFEKKYFREDSEVKWQDIDLQVIKDELAAQEGSKLEFRSLSSDNCAVIGPRDKSESAAGKRKKSLILVGKETTDVVDLTIEFAGDELVDSEVRVEHNKEISGVSQTSVKKSRNRRRVVFSSALPEKPQIFRLRLDRSQTSERYEFSILIIREGLFHVSSFENTFLVNTHDKPQQRFLLLQTDERELLINPEVSTRCTLQDNGTSISIVEFGTVDFETVYEESDIVSFDVRNDEHILQFRVEGEMSEESLTLPLLMDEGRFNRLFQDSYNGSFLPDKQRVVIDNKETNVVATRSRMLQVEQQFVDEKLLCFGDDGSSRPIAKIREDAPGVFDAFCKLESYLSQRSTSPSLASWGTDMRDVAREYILAYQEFLQGVETGKSLDQSVRNVMQLGIANFDGRVFMTPFHPLVMSYCLQLATEIAKDDDNQSFRNVPSVTRKRLNARGLLPYVYSSSHDYCYTQAIEENSFWLEIVPQQECSYDYVARLTKEKIDEFVQTFDELFKDGTDAPLLINSVNNGDNREVFIGILNYFRDCGKESEKIHVNLYDDAISETEFDRFAELGTYHKIKRQYRLDKGKARENADTIIDLLRSRLTFSKFRVADSTEQAYAHLTLFRNNQKVERSSIDIDDHISGVACDGLLSGEASCAENQNYYTGFGLKDVETADLPHLEIARLVGTLQQPLSVKTEPYHTSSAIRLAVSDEFRELLDRSYDSSLWVTIIDPKVTLKFFEKTKEVVLIHFSDQYTSSAGYDAITVTRQTDLYREVLNHGSDEAVGEFNAFNGEWLLKMVTANKKIRREREGIVAAWKVVSGLVGGADITWIPMSVAEMIRVSGNIGLRMSDSDFARYHKNKSNKGRISDDVLFVGFRDGELFLLPIEVKTGSGDINKAREQARNLREYLVNGLFGPHTLEGKIYRSLLIRQILMQVEKYELYDVFDNEHFCELHKNREEWLRGDFHVSHIDNYPEALVIAHLDSEACFQTSYSEDEGIGVLKLPSSYLDEFLQTPRAELETRLWEDNFPGIPSRLFMGKTATSCELDAGVPGTSQADEVDTGDVAPLDEPSETEGALQSELVPSKQPVDALKIEFGTDVKDKSKVFWEPTNTAKVLNPNTAIIGTMGTGKTQFTKSLVTQLIRNQANNIDGQPIGVLILDYKADYVKKDFVEATGANVLNLHRLPFNPFALFGNKPMLPMHTASQFRATLAKAFGLGAKQQQRINSLVIDTYENAGIAKNDPSSWSKPAPTLQDVWDTYNAQEKVEEDSLYAALADLINFEIFEPDGSKAQSLYDMIDGVTVINLSGYDPVIQNLVVALTLDLFYAQMHQKGSSKVEDPHRQLTKFVLVDEADNFMKQEFPGLRKLLKEGREFGVGTILSTQELTHFKTANNDYSGYILSWIIHRVASIKPQDVKALFNTASKDEIDGLLKGIGELEKHYSLYVDGEKHIQKIEDLPFWRLPKPEP